MPPRRRIDPVAGQAALVTARGALREGTAAGLPRDVLATAVRFTLDELAVRHPGRSVEVRVPPYGAIQCVAGTTHRRGTPPSVVETDPVTWLRLASGELDWQQAVDSAQVQASGRRSELAGLLPVV